MPERNKTHKSKFASKRSVAKREQGRKVTTKKYAGPKSVQKDGHAAGDKERRRLKAAAIRKNKMSKIVAAQRLSSGATGVPKIVGVAPINEEGNYFVAWRDMLNNAGLDGDAPLSGPKTAAFPALKQRFTFVCGNSYDQDIVDVAKVADVLVLVLNVAADEDTATASQAAKRKANVVRNTEYDEEVDGEEEEAEAVDAQSQGGKSFMTSGTWFSDIGLKISDYTRHILQCLNAQGAPAVVVGLQGLSTHLNPKRRHHVQKLHERYFVSVLPPDDVKVLPMETQEEYQVMFRTIAQMRARHLQWRDQRPYMAVDKTSYDATSSQLSISGYLHGVAMSANQLVHLTNYGTYQMESVTTSGDPCPLKASRLGVENTLEVLDMPDPETQETLDSIMVNETADNEQTWPTEEEIAHAQAEAEATKMATKKVRVPEGVSDYQAAWYDFPEGQGLLEADADLPAPPVQYLGGAGGLQATGVDTQSIALSKRTAQTDVEFLRGADLLRHEKMTDEERLAELEELREADEEDARYPDEIETPHELPARQRFMKYRGMKGGFNKSPWNAKENLPPEYSMIYKLVGYNRIRHQALDDAKMQPVQPGTYITIVLKDVPEKVGIAAADLPHQTVLIASVQLQHEQKWSTVHYHVQRSSMFDDPIKSKTTMLAHIGFRKIVTSPLFSDVSVGDRTKFARYFHPEEKFRIATFFGPITYHPSPILFFEAPSAQEVAAQENIPLMLYGGALPPNPDLLILKRVVLTGRVHTIHKKQIVVKYMFFNDEDVRWFMPVELYTKLGRRGKITKSIGSHGLFKAVLNDMVMQHDVVCMDLYKRVYPKWTTATYNVTDLDALLEDEDAEEVEETSDEEVD